MNEILMFRVGWVYNYEAQASQSHHTYYGKHLKNNVKCHKYFVSILVSSFILIDIFCVSVAMNA